MFQRLARRTLIVTLPPASDLFGRKARACAALFALAALGLGGCAQQPQQVAAAGHPKEYFPSSVYGAASRRVIADGQPVPRGGGQYLVGKPYTIAGQTYYPSERRVTQVGLASWYGDAFHGRLTANGEIYDRDSFTAAHPTMPLPSYARVTNLRNNTSMIVRVNDRGPYHSNRIMDVSRRVADALDIRRTGTAKVKVEWVARASLAGSDDAKLAATLRNDGPALANGIEEGIQLATAPARAVVASLGEFAPAPAPVRLPPRPTRFVEQERPDALKCIVRPIPPRRTRRATTRCGPGRRTRRATRIDPPRIRSGTVPTTMRPVRSEAAAHTQVDRSRRDAMPPAIVTATSVASRASTIPATTHEPRNAGRVKVSMTVTARSVSQRRRRFGARSSRQPTSDRRRGPSISLRWPRPYPPTSRLRCRAGGPTTIDTVVEGVAGVRDLALGEEAT